MSTRKSIKSTKDIIMVLLYARGPRAREAEPIRGRTRLMKMVFLFDKEIRRKLSLADVVPDGIIPDFRAYHYGPFLPQVFSDLEFLVDLGFVQVREVSANLEEKVIESHEFSYWQAGEGADDEGPMAVEEFELSPLGKEFVTEQLAPALSAEQWRLLDEFKRRCCGVPLRVLLRYVYTNYPEMAEQSEIKDEILSE